MDRSTRFTWRAAAAAIALLTACPAFAQRYYDQYYVSDPVSSDGWSPEPSKTIDPRVDDGRFVITEPIVELCSAVTPVVHAMSISAPTAGTGNSCTNDLQCTGHGEACVFIGTGPAATGSCQASGHLKRDDIHYVAGKLVDVDVTVPDCVNVSDVLMSGASLTGSGFDYAATPASWSLISSKGTTVNGAPAHIERVRVQFPNAGDGLSTPIQIKVSAVRGGATAQSAPFTLSRVAAVNAAMRTTVAETRMRNDFVTKLYQKFGDSGGADVDGHHVYALDYENSDIRIRDGHAAFTLAFMSEETGCDPEVHASGSFDLVPYLDSVMLQWVAGPSVWQVAGTACQLLSLGSWQFITDAFFDANSVANTLAETISGGFDADPDGRIKVCDGCSVKDVQIHDGLIEIWAVPPTNRVRVNVSTELYADRTINPESGLMLPAGFYAPIVGGESYETCQTADGQSPATCSPKFVADMNGLFNWWGSDVPVPGPIVCNEYGVCTVNRARQAAWGRLLGLTRDVTKLPEKAFPAGSLLARRTPSVKMPTTTRARVSNGCVMPIDTKPYKVSFGVNDMAVFPGGAPPARGKLDATILMATNAGESKILFGTSKMCQGAPGTTIEDFGGIRIKSPKLLLGR